jgi:hypothetical protein
MCTFIHDGGGGPFPGCCSLLLACVMDFPIRSLLVKNSSGVCWLLGSLFDLPEWHFPSCSLSFANLPSGGEYRNMYTAPRPTTVAITLLFDSRPFFVNVCMRVYLKHICSLRFEAFIETKSHIMSIGAYIGAYTGAAKSLLSNKC